MLAPLLALLLTLLAVAALLVAGVSFLMARVLLTPERMVGGRAYWLLQRTSPADLDLPYEELSFTVRDESPRAHREPGPEPGRLRLAAWWIPAPVNRGRCAMLVHGYSDSKVGAIAWAPTFRALGWNVLAVDLRAHGESDGVHSTAGYFERHDLSQVIDRLRELRPAGTRHLALFGISLGAGVACAAAAARDGAGLAACILDCPYADYPSAARTHGNALGMPGPLFQDLAIAWAQRISGANFMDVAPARLIPTLRCPLMVIHEAEDLFIARADMDAVEAATRARPPELGPTVYWRVEDAHHVLALAIEADQFQERVGQFLDAAVAWRERGPDGSPDAADPADAAPAPEASAGDAPPVFHAAEVKHP